jgi:N-acetylmuramoyl-L-alanine amidase
MLLEKGAIVYMTREGDYDLAYTHTFFRKRSDLARRARLINDSDCDLYLSIHLNATLSTTWKGAQVFYNSINPKNKEIGEVIQSYFKRYLGSNRKLKEADDLYMYKDIRRPGVLLEVGFLSNPNERYLLKGNYYQRKICNTIVNSLLEHFSK